MYVKRMLKNKIHYFLLVVLLNSLLLSGTLAISTPSLFFHGVGLTVNLDYPEEAHPTEEIYHNVTITSKTDLTIINFTLTIYGTVNQTQQEITNLALFSWTLDQNNNNTLTNRINFTLPQETFGRLYCTLYAKTNQDTDYFFTSFYTTHVQTITFSELLIDYNQLLANYTNNQIIYDSLLARYESLENQKDILDSTYDSQIDLYNSLQSKYTSLNTNYTASQENFNSLNNNYTVLNQTNTDLEQDIINLEQKMTDAEQQIVIKEDALTIDRNLMVVFILILVGLIGLIIYLRNKQKEPYVVIRKETVSVKPKKN